MKQLFAGLLSAGVGAALAILALDNGSHVVRLRCEIPCGRLPESFDGFRILHLSDLHKKRFGKNYSRLTVACRSLSPDIIVFTGDLFSRDESLTAITEKLSLIRSLLAIAPVYFVRGNHEADSDEKAVVIEEKMRREGVTVLRNERTRLVRGGDTMMMYGLELEHEFFRNACGGFRDLPKVTRSTVFRRIGEPDDCFGILLAHDPLHFDAYADWGADLTLSGHVHGGVIRLFGVGLLSPERRFFPKYSLGLYRRGSAWLEVSPGLGKFRFNDPSAVTLCILRRQDKNG